MVTHDTDVEELLDLVIQAGKSIQENSKVLETMTEIVIKVAITIEFAFKLFLIIFLYFFNRVLKQLLWISNVKMKRNYGRMVFCDRYR